MTIDYLPPILIPIIGIFLPIFALGFLFLFIEKESIS